MHFCKDSREIKPGDVYVGIKGEKHKSKKITRDFLLKLPEHLKEMKKDPTLADTLRVKPDDLIMDEHAASSPDIVHETSDKTH